MPLPEKPAGVREIFIEDHVGDSEVLWLQVDQALASGARVWVRSPLLDRLLGPLGELRKDKLWLKIQPPGNSRTSEFLRVRDLILAALSLALLAPLMLVLAILVKLSSPGPVFYQTQVAGKDGRLFLWRKFRSMAVAPEKDIMEQRRTSFSVYAEDSLIGANQEKSFKVIDWQRVTPLGRFIRKHSLDELPQLGNVFLGQMSLVGPRPCLPYEMEFFSQWRQRRFSVPPGLTGMWQVFGRGRVGHDEAASMDVFYTYRRSWGLDLYLILKTVVIVLTGQGAA